jgi:hypothetical protein
MHYEGVWESGVFLTSELVGGEWSASRPCGTHRAGGRVGPAPAVDAFLTLPPRREGGGRRVSKNHEGRC